MIKLSGPPCRYLSLVLLASSDNPTDDDPINHAYIRNNYLLYHTHTNLSLNFKEIYIEFVLFIKKCSLSIVKLSERYATSLFTHSMNVIRVR